MRIHYYFFKRAFRATLLVLLLTVAGMTKAWALSFTVDNLNYTMNPDGVSVTVTGHVSGTSFTGALVIPESVTYDETTYTVTIIGESAFYYYYGLTSVAFPNSLIAIGEYAFYHCNGLSSLSIPDSVTTIGDGAFQHCENLNSVSIGNSVVSIGYGSFSSCSSLTYLTFGASVVSIGEWAFSHCSSLPSVAIPNSVTTIRDDAFNNCTALASLTLGNSVSSIGESAFRYCSSLTSLAIPASVTSIGENAFGSCSGLEQITVAIDNLTYDSRDNCNAIIHKSSNTLLVGCMNTVIPNTITTIGERAFAYCSGLTSITIPPSVTFIDENAFSNCYSLTTLNYNATHCTLSEVGSISSGSPWLYRCDSLVNLNIGENVQLIPPFFVANCKGLEGTLTIPNSVTSIGEYAFYRCEGFTSLSLGNSVSSIDDYAFQYCSGITSLAVPASVATIGKGAFSMCSGLEQITVASDNATFDSRDNCNAIIQSSTNKLVAGCMSTVIPDMTESIAAGAFAGCTGLASVTIPESVNFIGGSAFSNCYGLTTLNYNAVNCVLGFPGILIVINGTQHWLGACYIENLTIGENVQHIPNNCFEYGISATGTLVIPNSVITIGNDAFHQCSFSSVVIGNSVTSIGSEAFRGCSNLTSATIPNSVTSIGDWAFGWCTHLTLVELPNSLTTINDNTFCYCERLESVTIPNSVVSIGKEAFRACGLTSLDIPNSVTTIEEFAFYGCSALATVSFGSSVNNIGDYAFYNCSSLTSLELGNSVTGIGHTAFGNCSSLTSLVIPNSVSSIEGWAFVDCNQLALINVLAETPPTLGNDGFVFENVPTNIPVIVPCGTLNAYQGNTDWSYFTNYIENCGAMYEIGATANPEEGGTVTGSGTYGLGTTCTLTATANMGYTFVSRIEDGEVVSSDSEFSFTVLQDRNLVATFMEGVLIGDGGDATNDYLPSYNYYKYSLSQQIYTAGEIGTVGTITSIAFYNGRAEKTRSYDMYLVHTNKTAFENGTDWVAVTEDNKVFSGEVTMVADNWTTIVFDTPFEFDGVSNVILVVDDNSGAYTNSPHMSCRVFEAPSQAIYVYADSPDYDPLDPTSYYGTVLNVKNQIMFYVETNVGQTINLQSGWNWCSFDVEITLDVLQTVLVNALGNTTIQIKSKNASTTYNGNIWRGSLKSLDKTQMYKINTPSNCVITLFGIPINPAEHIVTIRNGVNWICFPLTNDMSLDAAFNGFAFNGDLVKSKNTSSSFNGSAWRGLLSELEPGKGYIYKSSAQSDRTFTFPINTK